MSDDNIQANLELNFTGNAEKDLPKLLGLLNSVEAVSTQAAGAFDEMNNKAQSKVLLQQAQAAAAASKEFTNLAKSVERVSRAQSDSKSGVTGLTPFGASTREALPEQDSSEFVRDVKNLVSMEESIQAAMRKTAAEAQRVADENESIVKQDLALIQRRLDAKRDAARQEITLAEQVAQAEAEAAARGRQAERDFIQRGQGEQNAEYGLMQNRQYWADEEARIKNNSRLLREQMQERVDLATRATAAEERAARDAQRRQEAYYNSLSNTRYALYDVSRTATIASVALLAAAAVPVGKYASYTKEFASVARTVGVVGDEAALLREEFIELSTVIPQSFSELAEIGTLAGQLDIPAESVAKFTEVVAKFAATTDVTAQTAAEQIGRTAQLTQTAASEYENLASSIYQVGVTSVATEGQILEMMSQISTAGNLAGLSNVEIVALAGSLSSLGIQPEAARGSLQRLFNMIENGATTSTKYTQQLAEITGMTADEMSRLWKDGMGGSQAVFSAFVQGLGEMQEAGTNTTNVLREMGVYQVRDQRLLQVLSNNTEVYTQALQESANAYANGTALAEGYAKQTDNLAYNLELLLNTLGGIAAEMGEFGGGALNEVVKGFTEIAKSALAFMQTDVGKIFGVVVTSAALAAAGLAAYIALTARMQASIFGLITAHRGLQAEGVETSFNLHSLTMELFNQAMAFKAGALSGEEFAGTVRTTGAAARDASGQLRAVGASTVPAEAGMRRLTFSATQLRVALSGIAKASGWMLALSVAIEGLGWAARMLQDDLGKSKDFWGAFDTASLTEAIKADTKIYEETGESLRLIVREQETGAESSKDWGRAFGEAAGVQADGKAAIDATTKAIEDQTIAFGENVRAALVKQFLDGSGAKDFIAGWQKNSEILKEAGFDLRTYFDILIKEGPQAAEQYATGFETKIKDMTRRIDPWTFVNSVPKEGWAAVNFLGDLSEGGRMWEVQAGQAAASSEILNSILGTTGETISDVENEIEIAGQRFSDLKGYLDSITDGVQGPYELEQAFRNLGESLAENGNEFSKFSDAGQKNVGAVLDVVNQLQKVTGEDQAAFGEQIIGLMAALQAEGVNTGNELSFLGQILNDTLGGTYNMDFNSAAAQASIVDVIDKAIAAQQAIINLNASAISSLRAATLQGATPQQLGQLNAAQAAYNSATSALSGLEQLRTAAVASSGRAHADLTKNVDKGTAANKKNSASSKEAARSILDWVDDLRQVMKTADELRFGVQDAWDAIVEAQKNATESLVETTYDIGAALDKAVAQSQHSDNLWSIYYSVQDEAEDAANAVVKATNDIQAALAELQDIGAERSQLEYGLGVATMYGDELRAAAIRAKLAELDAKQAKTQTDLSDAQKELADAIERQNMTLVGNSKQAIKNRATVRDLAEEYVDWINEMVDGGATSDELADAVATARGEFEAQAVAMGFNRDELQTYITAFSKSTSTITDGTGAVRDLYEAWQDYIVQLIQSGASQEVINKAIRDGKNDVQKFAAQMGLAPAQIRDYVKAFDGIKKITEKIPKNLNVELGADLDPADKAIKDWRAKNTGGRGASSPISVPMKVTYAQGNPKYSKREEYYLKMKEYEKRILGTTNMKALEEYSKQWSKYNKLYKSTFSSGGFTGRGGKYDPAGIVHKGEYVVPKSQVNQTTGQPYFMERVNNITNSANWPSVIQVELSPQDRALLAETGGAVVVSLDGKMLAGAVNHANRNNSVRGGS